MRCFNETDRWLLVNGEKLLKWLKAEAILEENELKIDFIFLNNAMIQQINKDFLEHDFATDVVTFLLEADNEDKFAFGEEDSPDAEVYVSLEQAIIQSSEFSCEVEEEVARLMLHGLLHLSGWDDDNTDKRSKMSDRENQGLERARQADDNFAWELKTKEDTKD